MSDKRRQNGRSKQGTARFCRKSCAPSSTPGSRKAGGDPLRALVSRTGHGDVGAGGQPRLMPRGALARPERPRIGLSFALASSPPRLSTSSLTLAKQCAAIAAPYGARISRHAKSSAEEDAL